MLRTLRDIEVEVFGLVTFFEAKEEEEECLLIHLRRTASVCYRLGYCHVLVDRVYKHKYEAASLEINSMLRNGGLIFLDNCQL